MSPRALPARSTLSGVILTRMDGDARGGAALSMRAVTGKPIKFAGTGEAIDALEAFHPSRVAGRILGMGDVVSAGRARRRDGQDRGCREARRARWRRASSTSTILRLQISQMQRMGGLGALANMLPGHEGHEGRGQCRRQGAGPPRSDDELDDRQGARAGPRSSTPSARSASPRAAGPPSRRSTSCSRCTRKWPTR